MDPFESFKAAQKQGWAHFAPLEAITTQPAALLVKRAGITTKTILQHLDKQTFGV